MDNPVVAVLDAMPAGSRQVISDVFGADFRMVFVDDDSAEAKREAAAEAAVLLTMWGEVDATTIGAAPQCRVIQKLGVGTHKIDIAEADRRGIVVLNATGINAEAVGELTVLLMLAVARHLGKAMAAARTGRMEKERLRTESFQILGKTVGLLGFGHIGQAVARRLSGYGVRLLYHDKRRATPALELECQASYVEMDELIATSDVISLHLPPGPSTDGLINDDVLARTKPGLILVNTARGSLIDEHALATAIEDGRVLGAGLDVTAEEPLPLTSALLSLDRVILTPHVGGAVANNFPRVIERAYRNVRAALDGRVADAADVVRWPESLSGTWADSSGDGRPRSSEHRVDG
jgi:phosphoglycerate dehydrogenase-like enzyme